MRDVGVQQPIPPGSAQLEPCCCPAARIMWEQRKKSNPMCQEIQRDVPTPPRPPCDGKGSRRLRGWRQRVRCGTGGCAIPRFVPHSSVEEQLNNSTKLWACGSCCGYGTPGHRFPAEQPFLRGQIEVHYNINVVYAQAMAHKSHVTTSCISATSLP